MLSQKDLRMGNFVYDCRPITYLLLLWKIFTGIIADDLYHHLSTDKLLPEMHRRCRMSRGTRDQLLIDKIILKDCKRRYTDLAIAWIEYRMDVDCVPHSRLCEYLEMLGNAWYSRKCKTISCQRYEKFDVNS